MGDYTSTDRHGQAVLLGIFICLIGGTFTLDRIVPSLPAWDLRWIGLAVVGIATWIWVGAAGDRMQKPQKLGAGVWWFLAWASWMALASQWAGGLARTGDYVLDQWFLVAYLMLAWTVARRLSRDALGAVWGWMFWIGLIYFFGALYGGSDVQGRYAAFGGGPNVFVRVMLLAALSALFMAAKDGKHRRLLFLPVFLVGAALSGSRGGLLAFAAMCLVGGIPMLRRLPRRTAALFIGAGAILLYASSSLVGSVIGRTVQQRYIQETLEARYDSGRGDLVTQSWDLFQQHFFFGAGLDGYFAEVGVQAGYQYPHNLVLSTAAEGGLIGLTLLLGAVFKFVVAARRTRPMSTESVFLLLAGLFVLGSSLLSGNYYDSRFMWLFLGFAALEGQRVAVPQPEDHEDPHNGYEVQAGGVGFRNASSA